MAAVIVDHKGLKVTSPAPTGIGGIALNENFTAIADRLFIQVPFCAALSRTANTPPATPNDGDLYIVGAAPTGAWASEAHALAVFFNGSWEFVTPQAGTHAKVLDSGELLAFDGSAWVPYQFGAPDALRRFQFRITYTATNPTGIDPAEPLPAGWSASFAGALMTITHTVGKPPAWVSYLGRNGAVTALRYPTAVAQLSIVTGEEATKFTVSVGTATTSAASGSSALVIVQF